MSVLDAAYSSVLLVLGVVLSRGRHQSRPSLGARIAGGLASVRNQVCEVAEGKGASITVLIGSTIRHRLSGIF